MHREETLLWTDRLVALAQRQGCEVHIMGTTAGLPLLAFTRKGRDRTAPEICVSAGIHGDEPAGPRALEAWLRAPLSPCVHWTLCPLLNPCGWILGTRDTEGGMDLNRDYLALRCPETLAHTRWLATRPAPHLHLSLHEDWETQGFYLYAINTSALPSRAATIVAAVSTLIPIEPASVIDGHAVSSPGHIAHQPEADEPQGWPEAIWMARRFPLLSYTFETPSSRPLPERIQGHLAAIQTATRLFLEDWAHRQAP